jgi:hypothetical protein
MKTQLRLIACALALTSVASVAHAEEKRNAVSLSGNISSSSDFSQANVNAGYERLVTDKLSVSVNVLYLKSKFGGSSFDSTGVTGGVTYYIGQPMQGSNMLFYGKAVVGTTHTSGAGSESLYGGFGGLEQPIGENTSLFEELGFQRTKFAGENLNQVVFNFGLKLRF